MSDRANRIVGFLIGLVLLVIGGLGLSVALGAWGPGAPVRVVDSTVVRWWRDGTWMSYATLAFIGLLLFMVGLSITWAELHRRSLSSLSDFEASGRMDAGDAARGLTTVRSAPLRRALESDLRAIEGVRHASVSLLGDPGALELRTRMDVGDSCSLAALAQGVHKVTERLALTVGFGPDLVEVTLCLVAEPDRRLS